MPIQIDLDKLALKIFVKVFFINFRSNTFRKKSIYRIFTAKSCREVDKMAHFQNENALTSDGIVISKWMS